MARIPAPMRKCRHALALPAFGLWAMPAWCLPALRLPEPKNSAAQPPICAMLQTLQASNADSTRCERSGEPRPRGSSAFSFCPEKPRLMPWSYLAKKPFNEKK